MMHLNDLKREFEKLAHVRNHKSDCDLMDLDYKEKWLNQSDV